MTSDVSALSIESRGIRFWKTAYLPVVVAVAYYAGAQLAFLVGTFSDKIFAPFWPPNVVLFCALLLSESRRWWLCLAAALPAHALAEIQVGMGVPQMLVAFATNCIVALVNAIGVKKFVPGPPWFDDFRKGAAYVSVTAVVGPAISALGGAFVEVLSGGAIANYALYWAHWYASNVLGSLALGPLALILLTKDDALRTFASNFRRVEAIVLVLGLIIVCSVAFEFSTGKVEHVFVPVLFYLPLPFLLWSAVRFGAMGASAAALIITLVLIWRVLNGATLFAEGNAETNAFAVQLFLIGLSAPTLLLGAAVDQTRNASRLTRESEERMAFAAISAKTGLWEYCLSTGQFWATDYCRDLFGLPPAHDLTPAALLQVVHPEDRLQAADVMKAVDGGEPPPIEFRVVLPDGQFRWIVARRRVQRDDRAKSTRISGIFADITDRKLFDAETEQRQQEVAHLTRVALLGRLSGAIAHELNQPLTAILSNAQAARLMLSQKAPNLSEIGEAIDDIVTEDSRASEVIFRLRGLLKKGEIKSERIDLNNLITSTSHLLHSGMISRKIKLDLDLAEHLPMICGDPIQLQQVVLNLMMNSMEAVSSIADLRRTIAIKTSAQEAKQIKIVISDNGTGITAEHRDKLFEPFFTTKDHGLGLGLSICSSIVASHGGRLDVTNGDAGGAVAILVLRVQSN